jgi:hypothetical protein
MAHTNMAGGRSSGAVGNLRYNSSASMTEPRPDAWAMSSGHPPMVSV